jgi:hypothetical protein
MHPKWQESILQYYKALFTDNTGNQIVQLFIATHSDHELKEAFKDQCNTLVVVLNENSGIIQSKHIIAPNILPSITIAETNFLAFDIVSNDFRIGLYGWLHFSVYFRVQFAVHFLVYFVVQFLVNLVLYSTYPLLCTMYKRLWNVCKISQSQFF